VDQSGLETYSWEHASNQLVQLVLRLITAVKPKIKR
jgi:hypothetical protein